MSFAENLKCLMEQRALTNYQLAKIMDCHQTTIANWLSGVTMPQKRTLKSLSDHLGVSVAYLLGEATTQDGVIFSDGTGYGGGFAPGAGFGNGTGYGVTAGIQKEVLQKEKPTTVSGSELTEEEVKFLEWFRSQATEKDKALVRMIVEGE